MSFNAGSSNVKNVVIVGGGFTAGYGVYTMAAPLFASAQTTTGALIFNMFLALLYVITGVLGVAGGLRESKHMIMGYVGGVALIIISLIVGTIIIQLNIDEIEAETRRQCAFQNLSPEQCSSVISFAKALLIVTPLCLLCCCGAYMGAGIMYLRAESRQYTRIEPYGTDQFDTPGVVVPKTDVAHVAV